MSRRSLLRRAFKCVWQFVYLTRLRVTRKTHEVKTIKSIEENLQRESSLYERASSARNIRMPWVRCTDWTTEIAVSWDPRQVIGPEWSRFQIALVHLSIWPGVE